MSTSLRYQVHKIFPLLSTFHILERVPNKICMHFSQFSETTALCCKNISIMPEAPEYYAQNFAVIIRQTVQVSFAYRSQI